MKIRVDATKCDGYGTCFAIAPEVFLADPWGYSSVAKAGEVPPDQEEGVKRSISFCPEQAIRIIS